MIHLTNSLIRKWLERLLHIDDTPPRTAAAFALGVFFGFSPFLGLHTLLAVAFAFLLNLNRVAVLLGVYSNLPWFLGPYYAIATMVGARLTRHRIPRGSGAQLRMLFELSMWQAEFWHRLLRIVRPLAWPYFVGSMIGALLLAAAAYQVALAFVESRRRLQEIMRHQHHHHK
jgi:uncharacterized protein (DUF2062 family)